LSRLTPKTLTRWESLLTSKDSEIKDFNNDVYVWKDANIGLYPVSEEQWREEIINTIAKCTREGQPIQAPISSYLLETVAGKWLSLILLTGFACVFISCTHKTD